MSRLSQRMTLAWGWRRWLVAFLAGAVGALAMPPFGMLPMLALSLVPALWFVDGAGEGASWSSIRSAAIVGWWWGFGYLVAGLWWLGAAFLVEADQFAWAMPFGVLGLPAALACFYAFGFALARALWVPGPVRLLAFGLGLLAAEWLRGHLFTGFPWNTLGMALGQDLWLMQGASLVGLYGLTLLAVLLGAAPATIATEKTRRRRWAPPAAAVSLLAGLGLFGAWRVPAEPVPTVPGVQLRIMQPNLPQDAKFRPENRDAIMRRYLTISDRPGDRGKGMGKGMAGATHLIWPESAFPFLLHRDPKALAQIAALLPPDVTLITGAARMEEPLPGESAGRFFNAIQVIRDDGTITASYDKVHLVPFGEYVPDLFGALIRTLGLRQFVSIPGGFTPSGRRRALHAPGLPLIGASVCYEAIFPGDILPEGPRPGLLLNVTNDAWFGNTPGPRQHFAQARLRAVEEGLPLVRAANTGISAVIDPYGRIVASLPLGSEGILDSGLPMAGSPSIYAGFSREAQSAMVVFCLGAVVLRRRRKTPPSVPLNRKQRLPLPLEFKRDEEVDRHHRQGNRQPDPHAAHADRDESGKAG